jgi:hypothetical protein
MTGKITPVKIPEHILDGSATYDAVIKWLKALNKRLHNEWVGAGRPAGVFHRNNYTGWWSEEVFDRLERDAVVTYDKTLSGKLYKRLYILKSDRFVDGIQITWVAYPDGEAAWHKYKGADCFHYNF